MNETGRVATREACAKFAEKEGARIVEKQISKTAAKQFARTATSPALIGADVAEIASAEIARRAGMSEKDAKVVSKLAAYGTATGIGCAVGGPIGGATAFGIQGICDLAEATGATEHIYRAATYVAQTDVGRTIMTGAGSVYRGASHTISHVRKMLPF